MDYNNLKSLMESGNGETVVRHLTRCLEALRDTPINPELPAEQFKVNALARQEAIRCLRDMLKPFVEYQSPDVKRNLTKDSLYYSHIPRVPE